MEEMKKRKLMVGEEEGEVYPEVVMTPVLLLTVKGSASCESLFVLIEYTMRAFTPASRSVAVTVATVTFVVTSSRTLPVYDPGLNTGVWSFSSTTCNTECVWDEPEMKKEEGGGVFVTYFDVNGHPSAQHRLTTIARFNRQVV